ncbi:MAG: signal recognition particle-docking protein FtsY [Rickettsiaceae bacterium]|nr:signal recognition particle-docking protein FtsY [Rickettsiaceae bacterium]
MTFFYKIKSALSATSSKLSGIFDFFSKKSIDKATEEEIEEILLSVDFGVDTTSKIISQLKAIKISSEDSQESYKHHLTSIIESIILPAQKPLNIIEKELNVILFCGVNGNGKTTTIGKLSAKFAASGKKVMIAACDTFRHAAVQQLEIWALRAGCAIVKADQNTDPASVAFQAASRAVKEGYDILLIDTAGRLQNQANLMGELAKIVKVLGKINPVYPHHKILTLDATTGQNALMQVVKFMEIVGVNGLIFTKLDGTAKAGALVGITDKFSLPIYFLGAGEQLDDIIEFNAKEFARSLLS